MDKNKDNCIVAGSADSYIKFPMLFDRYIDEKCRRLILGKQPELTAGGFSNIEFLPED